MKTNGSSTISRRRFLDRSLTGAAIATLSPGLLSAATAATGSSAGPDRGLKTGIASYSLRKFRLDQAIQMTKEAGVRHITLKDMHLPLKSTREERQAASKKIADAGLVLLGCGVVYMKNDATEIRSVFEYAKDAGMPTIVCSPDPAALDLVEKMAKEYDILIAIHNHGPGDKRYPSPLDVMKLVKDRDARMGVCIDVGHSVRIGDNAVDVIRQCARRLHDYHIKDVNQAEPKGQAVEVGKGVIDIPGVLKTLLEIKFLRHLALEYEIHADAPMPGIVASFNYIRKVLAELP